MGEVSSDAVWAALRIRVSVIFFPISIFSAARVRMGTGPQAPTMILASVQ